MIHQDDIRQIDDYLFEIPNNYREDMRVPARFYADEDMLDSVLKERSLEQLVNTATLPGIVDFALAMPDIHQGYGFPIGGVVATRFSGGVVSPGGVGYDINCGVRLLGTYLDEQEIEPYLQTLNRVLYHHCPSGVGSSGQFKLNPKELNRLAEEGATWALNRGYATEEDLSHTEENGRIPGADPARVSERARERGLPQMGTLGSGNHFIEIDKVEEVFDSHAAERMGLSTGRIVIQIHCGSRGYGHQICTDYVGRFQKAVQKYQIALPDRELVCAPLDSPEGQDYLAAMACAANYAFANRQVLAHYIRRSFQEVLAGKVRNPSVYQIYDLAHNIARIEEHTIAGKKVRLCVHRKGATRAYGPGLPEVPAAYRDIGQPVLVPGSMGTSSWVLLGTAKSLNLSFGSSCHGAGRLMSRQKAKHEVRGSALRDELEARGIQVLTGSLSGLAEEAPAAYKDVDRVVEIVHKAGIAAKVARLRPLAVIKG